MSNNFALVGVNIEGQWNQPLLTNAASLSGAPILFVEKGSLKKLSHEVDHILACETGRKSKNIYQFPVPPGRIALVLGNEKRGISLEDLEKAKDIVTIPMRNFALGSVNVAIAGAIGLYVLSHDFAGKKIDKSPLPQSQVDVLIHRASNPHELGSLLHSANAFGWPRIFLSDPFKIWFTKDKKYLEPSRKAARAHKNTMEILTPDKIDWNSYDQVLVCDQEKKDGKPLSAYRIPQAKRMLAIYGHGNLPLDKVKGKIDKVYVDYRNKAIVPCFRHTGSIFLSFLSEYLG